MKTRLRSSKITFRVEDIRENARIRSNTDELLCDFGRVCVVFSPRKTPEQPRTNKRFKERKYLLTLPPSYPELHCYSPRFEKIFTSVVAVAAVEEADDVK